MVRQPWLVLLLLILCGSIMRESADEATLPFLLEDDVPAVWVELGPNLSRTGGCQIVDVDRLCSVIIMTNGGARLKEIQSALAEERIQSGYHLDIVEDYDSGNCLCVSFMAAQKRMALGIPLHPDRMAMSDWRSLPGIGEKLAQRIEQDRQENGDFGEIAALVRVKGISTTTIGRWKDFFEYQVTVITRVLTVLKALSTMLALIVKNMKLTCMFCKSNQ